MCVNGVRGTRVGLVLVCSTGAVGDSGTLPVGVSVDDPCNRLVGEPNEAPVGKFVVVSILYGGVICPLQVNTSSLKAIA